MRGPPSRRTAARRRLARGAFALCAAAAVAGPATPASVHVLEDVLARQERAIGDLRALRTLVLDVRMAEPDTAYSLTWRMLRPDRMRVDMRKLGLSVYTEGFGARGPWRQHALQRSPLPTSAEGGKAIANGVEGATWGRSLREMRDRGHSVRLLPTREAGEIGVRVVFRNGTQRDYFVDPRTYRIARSVQTFALHPDMEGEESRARVVESSYTDYRQISGYVFPMRIENRDRDTGEIVQTVIVLDVRVNEPLERKLFESR